MLASDSGGESEEDEARRLDLLLETGIVAVLQRQLAAECQWSASTLVSLVAQELPRRQWRQAIFGAPPPEGLDLRAFERPSRLGAIEVLRRSTRMLWQNCRELLGVEEMSQIEVRNVTALCDGIPSLVAAIASLQAQQNALDRGRRLVLASVARWSHSTPPSERPG